MPETIESFCLFVLLLLLNVLSGAVGFVPSVFLTALNIKLFGVQGGVVLTLLGEILGAFAGFHLYRYGFSKVKESWRNHRFWQFWCRQPDNRVFFGVLAFRLLPFIPSGLVTAGAAMTAIRTVPFMVSSTIGKIPAVLLELAVVFSFLKAVPPSLQYGLLFALLAIAAGFWLKKWHKSLSSRP